MEGLIRCPNCGDRIIKEGVKCGACGYKPSDKRNEELYRIVLLQIAQNSSQVEQILVKSGVLTENQAKEIRKHIPLVVYSGLTSRQAKDLGDALRLAGAQIDIISEDDWDDTSVAMPKDSDDVSTNHPRKILQSFIPVLVLLVMLIPTILENLPQFNKRWDSIREKLNIYESSFKEVEVIASRDAMKAGQILEINGLKKKRVKRERCPVEAISPLELDSVIGKTLKTDVNANEIILRQMLKSMSDDE